MEYKWKQINILVKYNKLFACFIETLFGKLFILFLFYLFYFLFYCISYNKSFILIIQCDIFLEISGFQTFRWKHVYKFSTFNQIFENSLNTMHHLSRVIKVMRQDRITFRYWQFYKFNIKKKNKENNYLFNSSEVFSRFLINASLMSRSAHNERWSIVTMVIRKRYQNESLSCSVTKESTTHDNWKRFACCESRMHPM